MHISDDAHMATVVSQAVWSMKECARHAEHADRSLKTRQVEQLREAIAELERALQGKGTSCPGDTPRPGAVTDGEAR